MKLKLAVLAIGDELINGEMSDTNTAHIASRLGRHGYTLRESRTVADNELDIEEALLQLAERRDVVIVTGGLGPTGDDLTARAAARAFGRHLVLNDEALAQIRAHFRARAMEMHPRNEKQALLPQKTFILPNPKGTAPGFLLHHNGRHLFFLPGVPEEMAAMLEASVLPHILELGGGEPPMKERLLKVFGLSEPKVEAFLEATALPESVHVAFGVDFPFVHVKLRVFGDAFSADLDHAEAAVRKHLGNFIVAQERETLAGNVAELFLRTGLTLSLAESCTGGLIAKQLTDLAGASDFLERCGVTYANSAKEDWLGVPADILNTRGAVSEECALAMARGIRQAAFTDIGLAVTGIAGPDGGTPEKPVGTVFIALSANDEEKVRGYRFPGDRSKVRLLTACMALEWLRRYLIDH